MERQAIEGNSPVNEIYRRIEEVLLSTAKHENFAGISQDHLARLNTQNHR